MKFGTVDHLWHEFILFAKRYDEFCKCAFGLFIGHWSCDIGLWWYLLKPFGAVIFGGVLKLRIGEGYFPVRVKS